MYNTIFLKHGNALVKAAKFKDYSIGDAIFGVDATPDILWKWPIEKESEAKAELKKLRCTYEKSGDFFYVKEFALEYCETDEDGDFICGSVWRKRRMNRRRAKFLQYNKKLKLHA